MYNAVNQFVLKMVGFNKIVVHADSGKVISFYMNISLACDYRIIGDNTVFQNPYLDLGLVPKGGGAFFLSRLLGFSKASELLLSDKDITAEEALRLGIVDKVVPSVELNEAALKIAKNFARKPVDSVSGIKRLLSRCLRSWKIVWNAKIRCFCRLSAGPIFGKSYVNTQRATIEKAKEAAKKDQV